MPTRSLNLSARCLLVALGVTVTPAGAGGSPPSFQGLGDLPGGIFNSGAEAVSANGSVIVGWSASKSGQWEAFRWEDGVMTGLGDLPGGAFNSMAHGVSADGSVVVGHGYVSGGHLQAFRWKDGVMTGLGYLPGGSGSAGRAASSDGSVVVGECGVESGQQAFRWEDGVMTALEDLPGGSVLGGAYQSVVELRFPCRLMRRAGFGPIARSDRRTAPGTSSRGRRGAIPHPASPRRPKPPPGRPPPSPAACRSRSVSASAAPD